MPVPQEQLGEPTGAPQSEADREWMAATRTAVRAQTQARQDYETAHEYRRRREAAYIHQLSREEPHATSFQRTVGDMFDAIFKQVEANRIAAGADRVPEFDGAVTRIAQVKAQFPAPVS
jgi:hypothetical protein